MKSRHRFVTAAAVVMALAALGGCATATPYQPYRPGNVSGVHGGYSEQQIAPDRYIVRFHGNSFTSRDRVEGYMLYRAAELTIQSGFDAFWVVERHTEHDVETYVHRDPFYRPWYGPGYDWWRPHWRYYYPDYGWSQWHPYGYERVDIRRVESFEVEAEIVMLKGPAPSDRRAFDARQVMSELGPTIELPKR